MNGVDESDMSESGSFRVSDGIADVIDSGSDYVADQKENVNKHEDDGKLATKLCRKTYVMTSAVPAEDTGNLAVIESSNLSSHNCINSEAIKINNSVPFSERMMSEEREVSAKIVCHSGRTPEVVEVRGKRLSKSPSPTAEVNLAHVNQFLVSADSKSTAINDRVLPGNCDPDSTNSDNVTMQLALSSSSPETEFSLSPLSDDVFTRTRNGESGAVDGEIILVDKYSKVGEMDHEWKAVNSRLISDELPTVHKEGGEAVRHPLTNCRMISARLIAGNLPMARNKDAEDHHHRQYNNSQLPAVNSEGTKTDRHPQTNSQSPTVCSEGSESDRWEPFTNCRSNSDNLPNNLPNSRIVGVETDRNTNSHPQIAEVRGTASDRQQTNRQSPAVHKEGNETVGRGETSCLQRKIECKGGGETDRCQRQADSQLPSVHKRQMLVDCDVNMPHSVWTTVINHTSLASNGNSSHSANEVQHLPEKYCD